MRNWIIRSQDLVVDVICIVGNLVCWAAIGVMLAWRG